jgi:hypothetical protein
MNPPKLTQKAILNYCAPFTGRAILQGDDKIETWTTLYLFQTDKWANFHESDKTNTQTQKTNAIRNTMYNYGQRIALVEHQSNFSESAHWELIKMQNQTTRSNNIRERYLWSRQILEENIAVIKKVGHQRLDVEII